MPSFQELYNKDRVAALQLAQELLKLREAAAKKRKAIPVLTLDLNDLADARAVEKAKLERYLHSLSPLYWGRAGMLHLFSPSTYLGIATDVLGNSQSPSSALYRAFAGENSGVVTENYAAQHPYLSALANMATDAVVLGTAPMKISAKPTTYTFRGGVGVDDLSGLRGGSPSMYVVTPQGQVVPRTITTSVPRTITLPGVRFTTQGGFNTDLARIGIIPYEESAAEGTTETAISENTGSTTTEGTTSGTQPEPEEEPKKEEPKKEEPKKTPYETLLDSPKINKGAVDDIINSYKNGEISYDNAKDLIEYKAKEVNIKASSLARLKVTRKALEKVSSQAVTEAEAELGGWPNMLNNILWKSGAFEPKISPFSSILGRLFFPGAVTGGIVAYNRSTKEDTNDEAAKQDNTPQNDNQNTEVKEDNKAKQDTLKTQPTSSQTIEFNLQ